LRVVSRNGDYPDDHYSSIGFRCALSP